MSVTISLTKKSRRVTSLPTSRRRQKNTKWENVYKYFERFVEGKCTFGEIDVDLCVRFMEYLQATPQIHRTEKKLHTNTAAGYWSTDDKPSAIKLV